MDDNAAESEGSATKPEIQWPLSFRIQQKPSAWLGTNGPKRAWKHTLYRGPDKQAVEVLYSKTKQQSEDIALKFLDQPVLGFDMEWPWNSDKRHRLQDKVGLIQIACEDKIALFHIGLHKGKSTNDLIAPSLKRIIESPTIVKTGVAILNADFGRLEKYFGLKPQSAFELSHLHNLVTCGDQIPKMVTTKLVGLAHQVEHHLGLPLSKGSVRTSDWSKPLKQAQIDYAAADAYACFMLYCCMNWKRTCMDPVPPLPLVADKYLTTKKLVITSIQLDAASEEGGTMTVAKFYGIEDGSGLGDQKIVGRKPKGEPLDASSSLLYDRLSERRKTIAAKHDIKVYQIAGNKVLRRLALARPSDEAGLLKIQGIGQASAKMYGAEWLDVIAHFVGGHGLDKLQTNDEQGQGATGFSISSTLCDDSESSIELAKTPRLKRTGRLDPSEKSSSSSSAFGSPSKRTPQLHTGLSFNLAQTNIQVVEISGDDNDDERDKEEGSHFDPDDSEAALDGQKTDLKNMLATSSVVSATPQSCPASQLKRKRSSASLRGGSPSPWQRKKARSPSPILPAPTPHLRSKLLAFSRLVTSKIQPKPSQPIVSERTLDVIVARCPRTREELRRIPGVQAFDSACAAAGKDLLRQISIFAPR
ncbi:hypothetical protein EJ04DRAFT_577004 [Polyplosphaeria fusca]|uniref:HRDC domain-containing protein n=1 Tax=Polyplosphaeria fusca TaxID=682080 RepID=A0A9P4QVB2_9PLEO|nr:hypothetical protein EJ04DRAFT_577004 [Polyplosphaeria fusca]